MKREIIEIAGVPIAVASERECEEATYVVCMRKGSPSPFTDNVESTCSFCGTTVFHRPYMPTKPARLCLECAVEMNRATKQ